MPFTMHLDLWTFLVGPGLFQHLSVTFTPLMKQLGKRRFYFPGEIWISQKLGLHQFNNQPSRIRRAECGKKMRKMKEFNTSEG